jgi:hypothetical protein
MNYVPHTPEDQEKMLPVCYRDEKRPRPRGGAGPFSSGFFTSCLQ